MDTNNNLFSASLEGIDSNKRVEKYQRFFSEFQRDCDVILNNAQEWLKAELPIVANYVELAPLKEELKSSKASVRRKHLLSALIFEQTCRDAVRHHRAATAAVMAIHMLNHIWQAKLEMNEVQPAQVKSAKAKQDKTRSTRISEDILKREQILTSLIKKGEQQKRDSQIQKQSATAIQKNPFLNQTQSRNKQTSVKKFEDELWKEAKFEEDEANLTITKRYTKPKKKTKRKKSHGVFSKMRNKIPAKLTTKSKYKKTQSRKSSTKKTKKPHDSLLDDPNNSAIMVSPGLLQDIDDSLIKERPRFSNDPNESGITVRKVLKKRSHESHEPGSNTIIMKLASSSGKRSSGSSENMTVPEQCQQAVNELCARFPGYDIVAIRNMAAEKVGVSPQYIENLNILPEN